jgi:hypothetical protein
VVSALLADPTSPLPPAISGDRWAHIGRCGTLLGLGSKHTGPWFRSTTDLVWNHRRRYVL